MQPEEKVKRYKMWARKRETEIETKEEERETHLLGPRISSRWSFVRRKIHSTFTYRRTSAIVNSLNKLFQLHRQRRGPLATENWNLRRILDRTESKVEKPWDYRRIGTQSLNRSPLSLSLYLSHSLPLLLHPFIPRPLFRTIVQLILIPFRLGETSVILQAFPILENAIQL